MILLAINFSLTDILVLQGMAVVLGIIIHFVLVNRRNLQQMIKENEERNSLTGHGGSFADYESLPVKKETTEKKKSFSLPAFTPSFKINKKEPPVVDDSAVAPEAVQTLKQNMKQQQKLLIQLLRRVDKWEEGETAENKEIIEAIEIKLEEKEAELLKTKQQLAAAQKMAARVEEVYRDFDALQDKMETLELQAKNANNLALELEDVKQAYEQVRKDFNRKQEKLEEVVAENGTLHYRLNETEDKLSEANMQRQQLMKKVQMLESMNNDLQQMNDANKKLQNELRRIGELESMLSMVSDERDLLLRKRTS